MLNQLKTDVFYYSPKDLREWWRSAFGSAPVAAEADFMPFRLESAGLSGLSQLARAPLAAEFLSFVCRKRAGIVWVARKFGIPA
jgi:hypothetical protein